jgi:hypothetical protein
MKSDERLRCALGIYAVKGLYMPRGCAEGVIVYKIRDKKGGKQSL